MNKMLNLMVSGDFYLLLSFLNIYLGIYSDFATLSEDLLAYLMLWFRLVVCSRHLDVRFFVCRSSGIYKNHTNHRNAPVR
jgi:hypothetical protein